MGGDIVAYWNKTRLVAEGMRKRKGWEYWGDNSEYLFNEVNKVYRRQHPEISSPPSSQ